MKLQLRQEWKSVLVPYFDLAACRSLQIRVEKEFNERTVYPPIEKVFNAFNFCLPDEVKVVILGQDPYFNIGQAVGLAFSVNPDSIGKNGVTFPPSLRNIIQEVTDEYDKCECEDGDLTRWAKQGVLLLNTCLTVQAGKPLSHKDIGWDTFINSVLKYLNTKNDIVYLLWGGNAKAYGAMLDNPNSLVLRAAHPSPLSANSGFFGCGHFRRTNEFLTEQNKTPIIW
jgi:uracil-DNA glycosylase